MSAKSSTHSSFDSSLLAIALDISQALPPRELYQRMIDSVARVFPCDAASLLIYENQHLVPVALHGLAPELIGQKFDPANHPRLSIIMSQQQPTRFDVDSHLPDPFDGHMALDNERVLDVHACVGCSLFVENELVGVLTLDAIEVGAFDNISDQQVSTFSALAAIALRNANLVEALNKARRQQQAVARELVQEAAKREGLIVGSSPLIESLRQDIATVADSDLSVLVVGETGTGKELVVRTLHAQSKRSKQPLVHVNCAALPENLAESELFGHKKGAFTGADSNRLGKFELADGGTLFLDEIGELPLAIQAKLLRALQQGEIQRVGEDKSLTVNVRVVAATNRNLLEEISEGRFRSDLYHRLAMYPIAVPPLRQHKQDVAILAGYFLEQAQQKLGIKRIVILPQAMILLQQYDWPGNVRELEHLLMRASLKARDTDSSNVRIDVSHLQLEQQSKGDEQGDSASEASSFTLPAQNTGLRGAVDAYQRQYITETLKHTNNNWSKAASKLKVDRANFYRLAKRLGLK
ncbi:nitric oxide reductase transcriptional regulator NorR [Paraferrimonas haliotis]|uniref:Anaerobic nitric oxide reductase transcription regulator n=1 Tax=Paraferrimonas haliotis TaxID=2013866 RepID=A0AA37TLK1_9GAMM|nr:nitric oxide reductase transcriptional regulator NorR [Paraferrimonas haliotis]GLS82678.1 anaerobic nitric oxide reductase transcription regulator [Paraferrimonas haliotis]